MLKHKLVDFIIEFMEEVDKEISEMKLFVRIYYYSIESCPRAMYCRWPMPQFDALTQTSVECAGEIRCRIVFDASEFPIPIPYIPSTDLCDGSSIDVVSIKFPILRIHMTFVFPAVHCVSTGWGGKWEHHRYATSSRFRNATPAELTRYPIQFFSMRWLLGSQVPMLVSIVLQFIA